MYASPKYENRCLLWANLKKVSKHHDLPWILMGDFNEMVDENEKLRGNPISIQRVREYRECMDCCNMLDLSFSSPKFTWPNHKGIGDLIQERLDRCWVNPSWKALYPKASVSHLAHLNSDHCPLLLKLLEPPPSRRTEHSDSSQYGITILNLRT